MALPTDSLHLSILLNKQLQEVETHDRTVMGILPPDLEFAEVESALEATEQLVSADARRRTVEFALPPNFFLSFDELIATEERRISPPAKFYLADTDYLHEGTGPGTPKSVEHYLEAAQFFSLLGNAADYKAGIGSSKTLIFLQKGKLEVSPDYSSADLCELPKVKEFEADFINSETHKDQKRTIVRTVLFEMFKDRSDVRFAELLRRFGEFIEKLLGSYQLYVSEFSFQKVKAEIEKEKLDATTKLNKVFSDIQSQLLAVPAALILVGGQMEKAGDWTSKNMAIWLGCLVFAILMTLLVRNQRHTLNAVKQEIDQQWQQIKGKYHSVAERFEASYKQLDGRYRHQKWLLRVVSLLVAMSLAASTILLLWFSVPQSSVWESLGWGVAAAAPLAVWDIAELVFTRYLPQSLKQKFLRGARTQK